MVVFLSFFETIGTKLLARPVEVTKGVNYQPFCLRLPNRSPLSTEPSAFTEIRNFRVGEHK